MALEDPASRIRDGSHIGEFMGRIAIFAKSVLAVGALCTTCAATAAPVYMLTDLGTLGGSGGDSAGINNVGQVTGNSVLAGDRSTHAFRYTPGAGMLDLGAVGGANSFGPGESYGQGINDAGMVTGYSIPSFLGPRPSNTMRAFRYSDSEGMVDLGTLVGGLESIGRGINNAGQVAGASRLTSGAQHAFRYSDGVGMIDLGTLGGGDSAGYAINDSGWVTGSSTLAGGQSGLHAFLYSDDVGMTDLGTLGGLNSVGTAINSGGWVTGFADTAADASYRAFLYSRGAGMIDLGTLGGSYSYGEGINSLGQVVGGSTSGADFLAFLYTDGAMLDLNSLLHPTTESGWTLTDANGINDRGQIVSTAYKAGLGYRAVLLTPVIPEQPTGVPEPATLALVSAALLGIAATRRSKPAAPTA